MLGVVFALLGLLISGFGWWRYVSVDRMLSGGEVVSTPAWVVATLGLVGAISGLAIAVLIAASG